MTPSALVDRYFRLASQAETDSHNSPPMPTSRTRVTSTTAAAIRAWRGEVPAVEYGVRGIVADGDTHVASTEISGDFPGSPVTLSFRFCFTADGRIESLAIRS